MIFKRKTPLQTVKGHALPAARLTTDGYRALLRYAILPFLGGLLLLDILLFLIFHFALNQCYGILCLL